jgi:hypothetical protein
MIETDFHNKRIKAKKELTKYNILFGNSLSFSNLNLPNFFPFININP